MKNPIAFLSVFLLVCFAVTDCSGFGSRISNRKKNSKQDSITNQIKIRVLCSEFEEEFYYPILLGEKKDLLLILAELSQKENPSIRFISTNKTEEIMEINGARNSWKEGWVIYINGETISSSELKLGVRVGKEDKIEIKLIPVERVFGRPMSLNGSPRYKNRRNVLII
ncbi:hypothetical protein LPTSP3_g28220 [Leptospira kobayashii]|uniref:Lipoprotein n=1 Tax=Leptospira kobayashii TaxID=1917830 RepID=A0ABM7ULM4_9LEPT|nr:hypothetical protein [Leptospira kobayashii]BDA79892.1 hypothetical protein LPTSP3_g28220 [Leptospira kobayashii]